MAGAKVAIACGAGNKFNSALMTTAGIKKGRGRKNKVVAEITNFPMKHPSRDMN